MMGKARALVLVMAVVTVPLAIPAQAAAKVHRIGFLSFDVEPSSASVSFLRGLHDHGYVEGRDFVMEYRWAGGHSERLPVLADELVRAKVDVIVTRGTAATVAAKDATRAIPIVFGSAGSPVEKGMVLD
jgi:putative ABC transport system substrate-binding protein